MITQLFFSFLLLFSTSAYLLNEEECLNYTVYPVQYELTIFPHIFKDGTSYYDCDVVITIIANAPNVNRLELDAKGFEILRESVQVLYKNDVNIINSARPYEYDRRQGKLYLYLKEDLERYSVRNTQYYIKMSFRKFLNNEDGIFVVKYNEDGLEKLMLGTRLSPNKAKYFFPCFENPQFEAGFKFKVITTEQEYQECNTSLVVAEEMRRYSQKDNSMVIQYIPSPQIAVYQVGFHHSDFSSRSVSAKNTNDTLVLWAPGTSLPRYTYILKFGQSILNVIHDYASLNRPLVYGPINIVAVPNNLENYEIGSWNLLTIGETKLANIPQYTSIKQKEEMSFLLTQQLCRIWLGNPGEIERTRWKEEWFKEGMATYLAYYFLSQSGRSFWDSSIYGLQSRHAAMLTDLHRGAPSLDSFNRTLLSDLPPRYLPLVRYKTAALLWMLENWLGSERFHRALVKYINTRRGKFISVEDFTVFLQAETVECEFFKGYTAADVLSSWFRQPGHPVVKVIVYRNQDTQDTVYLEQKQFTLNNATHRHHKYLIPISYTTQYPQNCYNCLQPQFTIHDTGYTFKENLNNGWIVLNRNASGYYRVNYDTETWKKIISTLKSPQRNMISPLNRAQIVNDAFALYMSGDINYEIAREIVSCLEQEETYLVWDAALSGFQLLKLDGATRRMNQQLYGEWKSLMRNAISSTYRRVYNDINRDDQTRAFKSRVITFACSIELAPCAGHLRTAVDQMSRSFYDPDLREVCYYTLLNTSQGYDVIKVANGFEREDFVSAERISKEQMRFLYKLPNERLRPMPLVEFSTSTNIPLTTKSSSYKLLHTKKASSSTMEQASVIKLVFILLIFPMMR